MSQWVSGELVSKHEWGNRLVSIRVHADVDRFVAGQFTRLGLDIDGERVGRPYSYVNAPEERPLEFYFITLDDGPLTPRLAAMTPGDRLWVAARPSGLFTLDQVPDGESLWMLSTGTALGVFLSILKTGAPWARFRDIVLVHGVRTVDELAYGDTVQRFADEYPGQFHFVPVVSREVTDFALNGRITDAIVSGALERHTGVKLHAGTAQTMLCGNPAMVKDSTALLEARGFKRNRRRDPGNITTEKYWG
jgi:ferredoxin--NADP+ reductase